MKVVTFNKRVLIQRPNDAHMIVCNPGTRYLLEDKLFLDLCESPETGDRIHRFSDGPPFGGPMKEFRGSRVLFSRLRGIGDELCMSGVVKWFADLGAECSVLATSQREPLWRNNPSVQSLVSEPLALDTVWRAVGKPHFDEFFHMESLIEANQEPDQENIYDMMYRFCGIDPEAVHTDYKRPYIYLTKEEVESVTTPSKFIFYQLHASNLTRSIPDHKTHEVLRCLNGLNVPILVAGTDFSEGIKNYCSTLDSVHLLTASSVREYFTYIYKSSLVIGPDSSAIHAAAAFSKPAIGFWGPFSPECRTKYYPEHYAIWDQKACKHSPCFPPTKDLPLNLCPKGIGQKSCEVFESVKGEEVAALVNSILN